MKKKIEYGMWLALQPMKGRNGNGYDRGSIFELCKPWRAIGITPDFERPYLSVIPLDQLLDDRGYYTPHCYPYKSSVFNMFIKIKNERNWFLKICDHDFDYHCSEGFTRCRKCKKEFQTKLHDINIPNGGCSVDSLRQEALSFRMQFGFN